MVGKAAPELGKEGMYTDLTDATAASADLHPTDAARAGAGEGGRR